MSDVLSDVNMYLSEPDETILTAALRNKDDIPILMDIVGDDTPAVSQAEHLQDALPIDSQVRPVVAKKEATITHDLAVNTPTTQASESVQRSTESVAFSMAQQAITAAPSEAATTASSTDSAAEQARQTLDAEMLADVIQTVLERKLPDIVQDVMQEMAKRTPS